MATAAQIAANRLNAMKSTGPRTERGREASRTNALSHGTDARLLVIPGEDPAAYEELALSYHEQFRPRGPEQEYLVQTLVNSDWLRRRYFRIEAEILNQALADAPPGPHPLGALHIADTPAARALMRVRRHYEAAQRAWLAAFKQLERLLIAAAEFAAALAERELELDEIDEGPDDDPPPQSEIGFVPSKTPQSYPAAADQRHCLSTARGESPGFSYHTVKSAPFPHSTVDG
jgi:hypothetical protein